MSTRSVFVVELCALFSLCSAALGCSGSDATSGNQRNDYAAPETPVIKPGSLVAYDVDTRGNVRKVSDNELALPEKSAQNWDWGDEGVHSPSGSGTGVEVEDVLSPGYVLMGLGTRVDGGAVTRLRLRQIGIRNDWSWDPVGAVWADWVRHPTDDGQNTAELELAISKPYIAIGLGMGISDQNTRMLTIKKREYSPSQRKLIGSEITDQVGSGGAELFWDTSFITHPPGMKEKMVVVGVGLRENADNVATLRVWSAYLD